MLTIIERFVFFIFLAGTFFITFRTFRIMFTIINRGQDRIYFDNIFSRISKALTVLVSQKTVLKSRPLISFL
jgi:hypothetical protein